MRTERSSGNDSDRELRFSPEERTELLSIDIGLTEAQVYFLEKALPLISYDLDGLPRANDVSDEIQSLLVKLSAAGAQLDKMTLAAKRFTRSGRREALGHLGLAAARLDRTQALEGLADVDGTVPERIDVAVLVRLAAAACKLALSEEVPMGQRHRRSGDEAIKRIYDAIARPVDPDSVAASNRLIPTRAPGQAFPRLCEIVFEAANCGTAAVENAIRVFMKKADLRAR